MKPQLILTIAIFSFNFLYAQYALDPTVVYLQDQQITTGAFSLPIFTNKEDVKYIGMGKTGTANGKKINAMMYNPALLSRSRFAIDAVSFGISLPPSTYDAANYVNGHLQEFKDALSMKQVWSGIEDFNNATDINQQLAAIKKIQDGLRFPKELFQKFFGTSGNPTPNGLRSIPSIAVQIGNFGFTLYGIGQSAFQIEQSPILDELLSIPIPDNLNDPQQVANALLALEGLLQPVMNLNNFEDVLPFAYSVSYVDVVGAAGYAFNITPNLSVGANLKVIHRRFSAKKLLLEQYNDILNILKRDLNQYITGLTMDIGGLYKFPTGTDIGFSIQNIIPVKKITSVLSTDFVYTFLDYKRDQNGKIVINAQGDTVIQSFSQTYNIGIPFDLRLPVIANFGAVQAVTENWDVAFDLADIAKQDISYEDYWARFRLGTEYRLDAIEDKLGVAFRIGMADKRFTGGIGLNIYRALQLDGAYAYDDFVGSNSYFVQVKLGW
jgi:hypothetical protein